MPNEAGVARSMLSVDEALDRILSAFAPIGIEQVPVTAGVGRALAGDLAARVTQPPAAVSAMDGYAVRFADVESIPATLKVIGVAPAGGAFEGKLGAGEAVRIFTGGPVPDGADTVVIQEDTEAGDGTVTVLEGTYSGRHIRARGLDFTEGDVLLTAGRKLSPADIGLAAAMNHPWLPVRRKPRVAILATGDEIVMPGEPLGANRIVSSNGPALAALVEESGGEAQILEIAEDSADALRRLADGARGADLLVTTGGASVGDHDLIRSALDLDLDFWKVAMRPGKPLIFGHLGGTPMIGVPGNPVSSQVCGVIYVRPAIRRMLGLEPATARAERAALGRDLPANDRRQDYLRAELGTGESGLPVATPFERQDSSMLSRLARADCLVVRPPEAPAAKAGEAVSIIRL